MGTVRRALIEACLLGTLLTAVIGLAIGNWLVVGGAAALLAETVMAYFVVDGVLGKSYLFRRVREWAFGARIGDWAMGILGLVVLWLVGMLWVWLGTAVVAVGLAVGYHFVVIILLSTLNPRALGINLQLIGAAVAVLGHQFDVIPAFGPVEPHHLTMIVWLGLAVVGVVVSRRD